MSSTIKRKIGGVLCAVLCTICLAVPVLAAHTYVSLSDYPYIEDALTKISDGVYEIKVSLANEDTETQEIWKQVMGEWMPDNDYILFTSFSSSSSYPSFSIVAAPLSSVVCRQQYGAYVLLVSSGHVFEFSLDGALREYQAVPAISFNINTFPLYFNNYEFPETIDYKIFSDIRELRITDDLDGEPEPPPSSSAPEVPDVPYEPGKPPTGGGTSDNLPYDPSIWEAFMWYMRDTIGGLGKVLILIAFLLSVVPLIISAIRHYAGTRNDNGGNLL